MGPVDTYYKYIEEIQQTKDYERLISLCLLSLPLLDSLIKECKRDYGSFDITKIPAIEKGSIYAAVLGRSEDLKQIEKAVEELPDLAPWNEIVLEGLQMLDISAALEKHLTCNPGFQQKKLKAALGFPNGKIISRTIHYMENVGKIRREKNGSTYNLFLA